MEKIQAFSANGKSTFQDLSLSVNKCKGTGDVISCIGLYMKGGILFPDQDSSHLV